MPNSVPILEPIELATGSNGVNAIGRCKDYAGNSFVGRLILVGNDTWVEVFKRTPAGALSQVGEFEMALDPTGHVRKMVDLHLMVDGANVVATVTGYDLTSPTRRHYQEEYVFANVAVPFPQGINPESGAGPAMWRAEGEPEVEIDYARIKADMQTVVDARVNAAQTLIIGNMVSKAAAAIDQKKVLTEANAQPHLHQFIKDRVYEVFAQNVPNFWQWLRDRVSRP